MTKQIRLPVYAFISIITSSLMLAGCIIHVGANDDNNRYSYAQDRDYSSTNKSVSVAQGLIIEDVSSVNGSVTLEDDVTAKSVSSVNGRVRIGKNVSVADVEAVNSKIYIAENFTASGSIETVNGGITIGKNSQVGNNIETVNGNIELDNVSVDGSIKTTNGSIYLQKGSLVKGDIVFEGKPNNNNGKSRPPLLKVDGGSDILGKIIVYKEVEFDFENSALMDKVERR